MFDLERFMPEKDEGMDFLIKAFDRRQQGNLQYKDFRRVIVPREVYDDKRVKLEKKS